MRHNASTTLGVHQCRERRQVGPEAASMFMGQPLPSMAVFPQECMGQLASILHQSNTCLAKVGGRRRAAAARGPQGRPRAGAVLRGGPPAAHPPPRKVLVWPRRCKLAHAFLREYSQKRLKLVQLLGQLGVFLTRSTRFHTLMPSRLHPDPPSPPPPLTCHPGGDSVHRALQEGKHGARGAA